MIEPSTIVKILSSIFVIKNIESNQFEIILKIYVLLKNYDCSLDEKTKDKKFNIKEIIEY